MSNTPEQNKVAELMKPRYKVIAEYPGTINAIGDVIELPNDNWRYGDMKESYCEADYFNDYPDIFKRLEWWEDRKPEEMPEYVKRAGNIFRFVGLILHIDYPEKRIATFIVEGIYDEITSNGTEPATQSEYDQYIKQNL